jgi:hypothetical protein
MTDLPDSYGTHQVSLIARDTHSLFVFWDFSPQELSEFCQNSVDEGLCLRIYIDAISGDPLLQVPLQGGSRHAFVPVEFGGTKYVAELGYYSRAGQWVRLGASEPAITPPDAPAQDTSARFVTIPPDAPFEALLRETEAEMEGALATELPLADPLRQVRVTESLESASAVQTMAIPQWTSSGDQVLDQGGKVETPAGVGAGSIGLPEVARRRSSEEICSPEAVAAPISLAATGAEPSMSSPLDWPGGGGQKEPFWFNVNAELVIYGATAPDARVTIAGRVIRLRPDGTFSCRFSLPDGQFELWALATAPKGLETRRAQLHFGRHTRYEGGLEGASERAAT